MKLAIMGGIFMAALAFTSATQAQTKPGHTEQQKKINQGRSSGKLTGSEAHNLSKEDKMLDRERKHALKDGKVTPSERKRLNIQEKRVSKKIAKKKNNDKKD
ncbi:hypothetical protein [Mucilaginibacter koreensis]